MTTSLLLVGGGNMGRALLSGWREMPFAVAVIEPNASQHAALKRDNPTVRIATTPPPGSPDIVVFAVKPQQLDEVLPDYKTRYGTKPLYVSIAAGKTLSYYEQHLGANARVIRAMPNTPAMVLQGATVMCANGKVMAKDREVANHLFEAVGIIGWVKDESKMDAVTALSGSGPAYAFLFLEAMVSAGIALGLPEGLAKALAVQTVAGACALADDQEDVSLTKLREEVTSKGGTTEAALGILLKGDAMTKLVNDAMHKAAERSKELSA